jgi:hypothetical protein
VQTLAGQLYEGLCGKRPAQADEAVWERARHLWVDGQDSWRAGIEELCALECWGVVSRVHGDLHLDNILIKKTSPKELYFREIDKHVETHGFIIKLMDFELSQTQHLSRSFFKDMHEFLRKLVYEYIGKFQDANILNRCVQMMMMNNGSLLND